MRPDYKTWTCGQCKRTVLVPSEGSDGHLDTLQRIGEHRLGHMVDTLMHGSDEDLWGLAGEDATVEPVLEGMTPSCWGGKMGTDVTRATATPPVDSDDLAPVLAGIEGLLAEDLPRARRIWYPIREDGGFNR